MADRQESVVLTFEVDEDESIESINKLTKANKELRAERNALNLQSEAGKKRAQEINSLLDQNTNKIKTNVSAIEKQKINIGNYKSALDGVHPVLGKVGEGLEKGTSGFLGMAKAALAFIATPIGAILAALVAVFTLLKTAISTSNEVFEKFENVTNAIGVVMNVLINRVGKLGEALIALATGDIAGALEKTKEAFTGIGDEIERAVGEGRVLLEMTRDLEDAQRQLRIEQARQENVIKSLVVASKNRNLTLDEQEDKLRKALSLEQKLVSTKEALALKELEIATRTIANDNNIQKSSQETFEEFANRIVKTKSLDDSLLDVLVDNIEKLEQARGSSLAFQEKVENQLAAVQEKRALALEKQNKALEEQAAQERALRRAQNILPDTPTDDPLVGAFQTRANLIEDINERMNKDIAAQNEKFQKEQVARAEQGAQLEIEVERAKTAIVGNLIGSLANLAERDSEEHQVLASAQALINTYLAATAALASGSEINPVFGILSAAAAVVNGLNAVARINGIQFAEGGWTGPGPKMKAVGVVHADEYVTPKRVVHMAQAQPHLAALERLRGGYADGGLVTDSLSAPINQQLAMSNILKNMPPVIADWSEGRKVGRRLEFKERISKR